MSQPPLPLEWYEPHQHGDGVMHQHFIQYVGVEDHLGVKLVPFDPQADVGPVESTRQRSAAVAAGNAAIMRQLQAMGAYPEPLGVLMVRLNTLIDTLDEATRANFDLRFELAMANVLRQCQQEANAQKLLAPLGTPAGNGAAPRLFVPPNTSR